MKKKNYKKIIRKIENTRKKNNKNWMDILRLAFKSSPVEASKILSEIYGNSTYDIKWLEYRSF